MKLVLLLLSLATITHNGRALDIAINEVVSSNGTTIADEDGDFEDWIELHNYGDTVISLGGFFLSDDPNNPQRWTFPDVDVEAGEFLLIWASGKDRTEGTQLHTNFSIAQAGEDLLLSAPDGTLIDEMNPVFIPRDRSYGRSPDGTGPWTFFVEPTPGRANVTQGYDSFPASPTPSADPGLYTSAFYLELESNEPGSTIHYTLDGSVPDETSPAYIAPIHIRDRSGEPNVFSAIRTSQDVYTVPPRLFKGTVVRAIAVADGHVASDPATLTYLVSPNIESRFQLPIVSIAVDGDSLFGHDRGIYVPGVNDAPGSPPAGNYSERGRDWERPVHLEFFEADGQRVASLGAGLRIHGGYTRSFRQKSLRIYFRSEYDEQNALEYPIFPRQDRANFKRLILRNSGNDFGYSMFRDAMMQRLVGHLGFDTQDYRPMVVFINGEFWGLHNLRERFDDRYVENVWGVNADDVDMLENTGSVIYGENEHYLSMLNEIDSGLDLSDVEKKMDIDGYINYQLSQIYFDNSDWPNNNIRFWRKRTAAYEPDAPAGHDGRWRWMMYDTDFGFGLYGAGRVHNNTLGHALNLQPLNSHGTSDQAARLLRGLLQYPDFRVRFLNTFADQLNTVFRPDHVIALIDEMQEMIRPIYDEHRSRWGLRDAWGWNAEVGTLRAFARQRPAIQRSHLTRHFSETTGTSRLTVDVSDPLHGKIRVNTIDIDATTPGIGDDPYPWSGDYFRNVPVTIIAKPRPGFRLAQWEGVDAAANDTLVVTPGAQRINVTATFERYVDPTPEAHVLASAAYRFSEWPADAEPGTYPPNMEFRQSRVVDPDLSADFPDLYTLPYDMTSTTRIEGLLDEGIAFINTGNSNHLVEGASGRDLGAAVLALNTEGCSGVFVSWTGRTERPNFRNYAIRLQYRQDDLSAFQDVLDASGNVVEYERDEEAGHSTTFTDVPLPEHAANRPYAQVRWIYHHRDITSGARAMLALDDIEVSCEAIATSSENDTTQPIAFALDQNYPNPFNPSTDISYQLPERGHVTLTVINVLGQEVATLVDEVLPSGVHTATFQAGSLPSGVYLYRLESAGRVESRSMVLLK